MKIILDYFGGVEDDRETEIGEEVERIGSMIAQGFTSGELVNGTGRGWWSIEK